MEFEVPFNRQQMADYLNLDRSALSKALCKMLSLIHIWKGRPAASTSMATAKQPLALASAIFSLMVSMFQAVSYTHLDVYKRQPS